VIDTPYFDSVKGLMDEKIITGDTDGLFHPQKSITRAEFSVMMANAIRNQEDLVSQGSQPFFLDLAGYGWASEAIDAIYKAGIIKGVGDRRFAPGNPVTYVEAMAMIARASGLATEIELNGTWPQNYIDYAQSHDLTGELSVSDWTLPAVKGDVAMMMFHNLESLQTAAEAPLLPSIDIPRITDLDLGNGMVFGGEEKKMSLTQAKELVMTSSAGIEVAKINLAANKAKTESYYQTYRKTNATYPDPIFGGTITSSRTEKAMTKLMADFAKTQSENNYQAEINLLSTDAIKNYFELQQAIRARTISENNLATQATILKNTNSKYRLGVVSKQDVLRAEVSYNQAKTDLDSSRSMEALARMNYNSYFSFHLMQKVALTDSMDVTTVSTVPLEEAIKKAKANRNEVAGAAFMLQYRELNLTNVGNNYSKASSYYLQAQADLMAAQKTTREMPVNMEMDVRAKYMDMMNAKAQADLGKLSADKAAETYRLAQLQYDMGMATLTDVQQAQSGSYAAQLQHSQSLLKLKLAVMAYETSMTVGTYSVPF
jgi:outer membrane protein TolC